MYSTQLVHTAVLHLLFLVLDGGQWVTVGCYNHGSRSKKYWKPLLSASETPGLR